MKQKLMSHEHTHERRYDLPFTWPSPAYSVVLVEPEIPPNTGNIARLCAATGTPLHLVGHLGFHPHDRNLRRAGVDYWDEVNIHRHVSIDAYLETAIPPHFYLFSTRGERSHFEANFHPGDAFIFGKESAGLSDELLDKYPDNVLQIPMRIDKVRSLNLANSVSIVLYEALRQNNYRGE